MWTIKQKTKQFMHQLIFIYPGLSQYDFCGDFSGYDIWVIDPSGSGNMVIDFGDYFW